MTFIPSSKSLTASRPTSQSLSAFGNVQSDVEILYLEASYTRVRGLDDSETVKCSAMHCGVTCSKFKSVNGSTVCKIATQHFPQKFNDQSHVRLRNNIRLSTAIIVRPTFCRGYYIPGVPASCYPRRTSASGASIMSAVDTHARRTLRCAATTAAASTRILLHHLSDICTVLRNGPFWT